MIAKYFDYPIKKTIAKIVFWVIYIHVVHLIFVLIDTANHIL
jgi:hypothetical protein